MIHSDKLHPGLSIGSLDQQRLDEVTHLAGASYWALSVSDRAMKMPHL